jgi:hypothetical protein
MQAQPNKNISEKVSPESGTARDAEKDGLSGAASAACARCVYMCAFEYRRYQSCVI